jgi:hypothetical protein
MKASILRIGMGMAMAAMMVSCASDDPTPKKKKKPRPPLPGEEKSDLSWNRPVRSADLANPLGMPTSR